MSMSPGTVFILGKEWLQIIGIKSRLRLFPEKSQSPTILQFSMCGGTFPKLSPRNTLNMSQLKENKSNTNMSPSKGTRAFMKKNNPCP